MDSLNAVFTKEYIAKLDKITNFYVKSSKSFSGGGSRRSKSKGFSNDFLDYRSYSAGDDLRYVDFNIYARFDKLYLKLFEEERQGILHFLLDVSKSMATPEEKAFESKIILASLMYLAISKSDKAEIILIGKSVKLFPFTSSKMRLGDIIKFLDEIEYESDYDVKESVLNIANRLVQDSNVIIISDFLYKNAYKEIFDKLLARKQNVSAIQILSNEELNIPSEGNISFVDSETGEIINMELSSSLSKALNKRMLEYTNEIKTYALKRGVYFTDFISNHSIFEFISRFANDVAMNK